MGRKRYSEEETGIVTNDLAAVIKDGDSVIFEESIKNATDEQANGFRQRLAQHVSAPKDDTCKAPESEGHPVGNYQRYGGPLAVRSWTLYRCKACGGIHGRLAWMA